MEECATFSDVIVAACNILLSSGLNKLWILLWLHSVAAITIISRSELIISTTDSFTTLYNDFPMQISSFCNFDSSSIAIQLLRNPIHTCKMINKAYCCMKKFIVIIFGLKKIYSNPKACQVFIKTVAHILKWENSGIPLLSLLKIKFTCYIQNSDWFCIYREFLF